MNKLLSALLLLFTSSAFANFPVFEEVQENRSIQKMSYLDGLEKRGGSSYVWWTKYQANFHNEKLVLRFPTTPIINFGNTTFVAFAFDHYTMYSMKGYFPPINNIDPTAFFDTALRNASYYPHELRTHSIHQNPEGHWILDHVHYHHYKKCVIKTRTIVTPHNVYTLQCTSSDGISDDHEYFCSSCKIN